MNLTVKEVFFQNTFPTVYNPVDWFELDESTNCYAYALNCPVKGNMSEKFNYVGAISGHKYNRKHHYTQEEFMLALNSDIKSLGRTLKESSLEEDVPKGFQKICVFLQITEDYCDFHFMREDHDKYWSHKRGWYSRPTNLDSNGGRITDPSNAFNTKYRFIGYFVF